MKNGKVIEIADMDIVPVNPDSPVPLYHQIETDLRRLINSGVIPPSSTMPPELELCRMYGVGRHTMRSALSRLVADGLITRRAGLGTVVQPQPDRAKFYLDRSFTRQMADMGRQAHSEILEQTPGFISENSPRIFLPKIGQACLQMVRLRFGDHEPIGLQSSTILTELCPGLENYDFSQHSLYDILATDYQLVIMKIQHTIGATTADDYQAELLRIQTGDPLLIVKTSACADNGELVEHTISYYRADRYEYSTTHTIST